MDVIEKEGVIDNVLSLEANLSQLLAPVAGHPDGKQIRHGQGLLAAIELTAEAKAANPGRPAAAAAAMRNTAC